MDTFRYCTYLLSERTELVLDEALCRAAAISGRLPALQYLREAGCPWADTIAGDAVHCGSEEVMQWLREQGAAFSATTMQRAAVQGNLEMVQYLSAEGCPWDDSVTVAACETGHLNTLHWLLQQECPIDAAACCVVAAATGRVDTLRALQEVGYATDGLMLQVLLTMAGASEQLATAEYLRQQGAEWPPVLSLEGQNWTGEVLAWASAGGCTSPVL
jgi:hypothetical protein